MTEYWKKKIEAGEFVLSALQRRKNMCCGETTTIGTRRSKSWMKSGERMKRQDSEKEQRMRMWERKKQRRNSRKMRRWKYIGIESPEREKEETREEVMEEGEVDEEIVVDLNLEAVRGEEDEKT
jgi:hypothetical protein